MVAQEETKRCEYDEIIYGLLDKTCENAANSLRRRVYWSIKLLIFIELIQRKIIETKLKLLTKNLKYQMQNDNQSIIELFNVFPERVILDSL